MWVCVCVCVGGRGGGGVGGWVWVGGCVVHMPVRLRKYDSRLLGMCCACVT